MKRMPFTKRYIVIFLLKLVPFPKHGITQNMRHLFLVTSILLSSFLYSQVVQDESIDLILDAVVPSESEPGITVGVVKNGELVYQDSRGCMNLEYNVPFNDSSFFGLASVTKQFTSACIGVLENQGKLSLNDDVRRHVPELLAYSDTIRIKHLLNHTSGLRNHNVLLDMKGFDYEHRGYTNEMIQELMFKQKGVNNLPGEKMLYSNTNYVLLALIIERVSGMKLHEFAKHELFEPLNMNHTMYKSDLEEVVKNGSHAYYKSDREYREPKSLTLCVGAGGVGSTIADLARWSDIFLQPNHPYAFLSDFICELDTLNDGTKMKHARGMFVSPYRGRLTFNHSGRDLGMRSQFICVPKRNLAVIVYMNSENINAVNVSYQILDLFLEEEEDEQSIQHYTHSMSELKAYAGVYQELNSDMRMEVFIEKDTLKAISSFGRNASALVSQTRGSFCREDSPSIVYSFQNKEGEEADLMVDFGGAIFYFERIELVPKPNQNLDDYTGVYYSKELDVSYAIQVKNDQLMLSYPNTQNLVLREGVKDTFGANRRTKYTFIRNSEGRVTAFEVAAEGTVKGILMEKTSGN